MRGLWVGFSSVLALLVGTLLHLLHVTSCSKYMNILSELHPKDQEKGNATCTLLLALKLF